MVKLLPSELSLELAGSLVQPAEGRGNEEYCMPQGSCSCIDFFFFEIGLLLYVAMVGL